MTLALPALVQSLASVRAAMGGALDAAVAALARGEDGSAHWRGAHAALQVVNHAALVRFSSELGTQIESKDAARAPVTQQGVTALMRYIDQLIAGAHDQPLRLAPAYEGLQKARGAQPSASDLFCPDLATLPEGQPGAQALSSDALRAARREYETGLLQWLKKGDSMALAQVGDAVSKVESSCVEPAARRPWWIARAVIEALLGGGLEPEPLVRRLLTQLNLYLGRLVNGPSDAPEQLLRDALYLAARAQSATPHIGEVKGRYALEGVFDLDAPVPAAYESELLAKARADIEALKAVWAACVEGGANAADFALRMRQFAKGTTGLGVPALSALAASFAREADALAARGGAVADATALEGAAALLMMEYALASDTPPEVEFAARAKHMAARLRVSVVSPADLPVLPPAQLLDAAALKKQLAEPLAVVHAEIGRALHDVELTLDNWFRDMSNPDAVGGLDKPLRQVSGALAILGYVDAVQLAEGCRTDINRHAGGAPCEKSDRDALVARLAALMAFVEGMKIGTPDLPSALRSAGLVSPDAPASPVGTAQTVQATSADSASQLPELLILPGLGLLPEIDFEVPDSKAFEPSVPASASAAVPSLDVPVDGGPDTDGELLEIFLEEADGVLKAVAETAPRSEANPVDAELLTELRRAFHTLKGSGRMMGLKHFGEAAWQMEQVMNDLITAGSPGSPPLYRMISAAHTDFVRWIGELRDRKLAHIDSARLTDWAVKFRAGEPLPGGDSPETVMHEPESPADDVRVGEVSISRSLYDILVPEGREHAATLEREVQTMQTSGAVQAEFVRAAHTMRGIMATAGLMQISALAESLERVLQASADSGVSLPSDGRASAAQAVAALNEQVRCVAIPCAAPAYPELIAALNAVDFTAEPTESEAPRAYPDAVSMTLDFARTPEAMAVAAKESPAISLSRIGKSDSGVGRREYRLKDDLDPQLLLIFLEEAAELVPQVGQDLRDWRARPDDKLVPQSLKRLLHTLKGSARMAGAMALGQLTHSMETRIENAQLLAEIPLQLLDDLETSFDRIGVLIAGLRGTETEAGSAVSTVAASTAVLPEVIERMSLTQRMSTVAGDLTQVIPVQTGAFSQAAGAAPPRPLIRVRADLVDRLSSQAGEISITRARVSAELRTARASLRDLSDNITRLRAQLRELEIQAETQMQSRTPSEAAEGEDFDPLEFDRFTRLQELTRLMAESVNDVATVQRNLARDLDEGEKALSMQRQITREVRQDLMAIRMIPLSSLSDRLHRVARLSAKDNAKRVDMQIAGGQVEMDRGVIDRVAAPIEHLLRNAIVHGIEAPAVRVAAGKREAGTLKLTARQEGNEIVLTLADDGAGLNIARIREKAIALGLMRENERLTDQQIANFIFRSGFSTAGVVTEDAGRGVGMDVVMSEITSLGGRVGTEFQAGKGTTFTIHLPLTLSVLQAVVMRLGSAYYAVPTAMVEQVQRLKTDALVATRSAMTVEWQGVTYPFSPLATLLGMVVEDTGADHGSVVLLCSGAHRVAIEVDDIAGGQEIVIKNIGMQLARLPGVTGAAVLESGETVLILNPVLLSLRYVELALAERPAAMTITPAPAVAVDEGAQQPPSVLVVDDSLTVRKITGRLLTRKGYAVLEAKDGIEALEKLREQLPDVMLTDVEMPRMDGFELTRHVRGDDRLKGVPIIMITSRTADKHRERASELGVDVFLGKPYEESALLRHIDALARRPEAL